MAGWWFDVPYGLISALAEEMDKLSAEEDLRRLTVGIAASGNMKPKDFKDLHKRLQRRANKGVRARKMNSGDLEAMSIARKE